jgi:hypothetical protein
MFVGLKFSSVAYAVSTSVVITFSTDFFAFQNLGFLEFILNFQQQKSLRNQYLPHFESNSYSLNSIKSCSSTSFQQRQRHIPIPPKFSAMI